MTYKSKLGHLPRILFVDDNPDFLDEISLVLLSNEVCDVVTLSDSTKVFSELESNNYSVVFLDWIMPGLSGADLLPAITRKFPDIPVIIMTGINDIETVVDCMKQGALDFITKPLDASRLLSSIKNAFKIIDLSNQNRKLQSYLLGEPVAKPDVFKDIITRNDTMLSIFKLIETIAPSRYQVFITGETGVGKELIARSIHKASGLTGNFVPLNVAGLDAHLFDDTLFGHKKGAFTDASEPREGLIAKAQGGTLFLDEIGDLAHESQVKLLRLIQENEYYRLGSDVLLKNNARIIVASNRDFNKMLDNGSFREDLYYRLCYHKLHIPPLRERRDDILPLAEHYAGVAARDHGKPAPIISKELALLLKEYDYPGNVRELIYKISSAVVANMTGLLTTSDFPEIPLKRQTANDATNRIGGNQFSLHMVFPSFPTLEKIDIMMVEEAMKVAGGNKSVAADLLGISRQTLLKKIPDGRQTETKQQ